MEQGVRRRMGAQGLYSKGVTEDRRQSAVKAECDCGEHSVVLIIK